MTDITMVRLYLAEGRDDINKLENWLQKEARVRGYTVFRGIAGLGSDGEKHTASLLDLSNELPVVIEFFDSPEHIKHVFEQLPSLVKAERIVSWPAKLGI